MSKIGPRPASTGPHLLHQIGRTSTGQLLRNRERYATRSTRRLNFNKKGSSLNGPIEDSNINTGPKGHRLHYNSQTSRIAQHLPIKAGNVPSCKLFFQYARLALVSQSSRGCWPSSPFRQHNQRRVRTTHSYAAMAAKIPVLLSEMVARVSYALACAILSVYRTMPAEALL